MPSISQSGFTSSCNLLPWKHQRGVCLESTSHPTPARNRTTGLLYNLLWGFKEEELKTDLQLQGSRFKVSLLDWGRPDSELPFLQKGLMRQWAGYGVGLWFANSPQISPSLLLPRLKAALHRAKRDLNSTQQTSWLWWELLKVHIRAVGLDERGKRMEEDITFLDVSCWLKNIWDANSR